jgi:tetratricopeptide (TPR) repeat protein
MKHLSPLLAALLLATTCLGTAQAADSAPSPAAADPLASARALIADNKWAAAIAELDRVDSKGSADWNNLMGYSHRKARSPDYAAAERYYDAALALNPRHRGALEYSGELFLMLGELPRAEQRLAALDKECFLPCSEYTDLKNAITRFKANGNRVAAQN